jgi:hypothetical protein
VCLLLPGSSSLPGEAGCQGPHLILLLLIYFLKLL